MKLKNKTAIVTGAAQGIGKEIALKLGKEGASVALFDTSKVVQNVLSEMSNLSLKALAVNVDVSNSEEVKYGVQKVIEEFGGIDILVNNVGIYPHSSLLDMKEEEWDKVLDTNLKSVFICAKAVIPMMTKKKNGSIINIASLAGTVKGFPNTVHYSASKAGILGFTRSAALELAPYGIRVNAIAPGAIQTPSNPTPSTPTPIRVGQPEAVASVVAFLASNESGYITGQFIIVDGGWSLVP